MFCYLVLLFHFFLMFSPTNSTNWITARHLSSSVTLLFNKNEQWRIVSGGRRRDAGDGSAWKIVLSHSVAHQLNLAQIMPTETNGVRLCTQETRLEVTLIILTQNRLKHVIKKVLCQRALWHGTGRKKRWQNFQHKISVTISKLEHDSKIIQKVPV